MRTADLFKFIQARHQVYLNKSAGMPKPWTDDPILQKYRFCNVYRELDKVTQWITVNWREPHKDDPDVWFAMAVSRWINSIDMMSVMEYPVPWNPESFLRVANERATGKLPIFGPAYMICTHGDARLKHLVVSDLFTDMWNQRVYLRPKAGEHLSEFWHRLSGIHHFGSFMAAQVVADTKYTALLENAPDWHSWAASGPGSRRGLNRVLGNDKNSPWKESAWQFELSRLHEAITPLMAEAEMPSVHAQDLQNCLCEFDKYERARLGEGRPKCNYL